MRCATSKNKDGIKCNKDVWEEENYSRDYTCHAILKEINEFSNRNRKKSKKNVRNVRR